jgi:hypothetical protein
MSFLTENAPRTPRRREFEGFEAPMSNRKARELLGFREMHNWRKYALGRDQSPAEAPLPSLRGECATFGSRNRGSLSLRPSQRLP